MLPVVRYVQRIACPLVLLLMALAGCQKGGGNTGSATWHSDVAPLVRAMPFLVGVVECKWLGIAVSRDGGLVPGPGKYIMKGYVVLSDDGVSGLVSQFAWSKASRMDIDLPLPTDSPYAHSDSPLLESAALVKQLPSLSSFHQGRFVLSKEKKVLYFELVKD